MSICFGAIAIFMSYIYKQNTYIMSEFGAIKQALEASQAENQKQTELIQKIKDIVSNPTNPEGGLTAEETAQLKSLVIANLDAETAQTAELQGVAGSEEPPVEEPTPGEGENGGTDENGNPIV